MAPVVFQQHGSCREGRNTENIWETEVCEQDGSGRAERQRICERERYSSKRGQGEWRETAMMYNR